MKIIDIKAKSLVNDGVDVAKDLKQGSIIILRDVENIIQYRAELVEASANHANADEVYNQLESFYEREIMPSTNALFSLTKIIKKVRENRYLSQKMANLIRLCGFEEPILLDGGISRLVLSESAVNQLKNSNQFEIADFIREYADGPTETFMSAPSNIHRDFNREHRLFMCNLWFPLHDIRDEESLLIYQGAYNKLIFNMENTESNKNQLGDPVKICLRFGDAILFHGEHMHASPISENRRHSYDFRIAASCNDDNAHYRYNFSNINNFITDSRNKQTLEEKYIRLASIKDHHANNHEHYSSNYYRTCLKKADINTLDSTNLEDILFVYKSYPFAEDRYLELAYISSGKCKQLSEAIIVYIIGQTKSYYWLLKSAELLIKSGFYKTAYLACKDAKIIARNTTLDNYAPIIYENKTTQMLPESAIGLANKYIRLINKKRFYNLLMLLGGRKTDLENI